MIMEDFKISINQLLKNPEEEIKNDRCHFFYDWFCQDSALPNRALKFIPLLRLLVERDLLDGDSNYVWFKNNCPMDGTLYDDMRISNIKTGKFLGGFCMASGHDAIAKQASFWTIDKTGSLDNTKEFSSYLLMKMAISKDVEVQKFIRNNFNNTETAKG